MRIDFGLIQACRDRNYLLDHDSFNATDFEILPSDWCNHFFTHFVFCNSRKLNLFDWLMILEFSFDCQSLFLCFDYYSLSTWIKK